MSFDISEFLNQVMVYWPPLPGPADKHGKRPFGDAQEVACRWQDENDAVRDKHGQLVQSRAKIYSAIAIDPEGVVWLGGLADLTDINDPFLNTPPAWEVTRSENIPDLENEDVIHKVYI